MTKVKFNIGGKIVEMEKDEVSSALETGEVKLNADGLVILEKSEDNVIYSKAEFEAYNSNFGKIKYDEGKTAQEEMLVKAAKAEDGLEFDGKKFNNYKEALKAKIIADAKIEPNTKITELSGDLTKLQGNYATLQGELDTYKSSVDQEKKRAKKDITLIGFLPAEGLLVSNDITLGALKTQANIDVDYTEAGLAVVTVNGQIQKDEKSLEPVDAKTFIGDTLKTLGLITKPGGGAGGGDEKGGKATDYDKFVKEMAAAGIDEGSQAFSEEMNKRISAKTLSI